MRQFNFTWTTIGWLLIGYGLSFIPSHAQAQAVIKKFSLELKNESLPEALKQIEKKGGKSILFTYNGTESYRVTASIHEKTECEAIDIVLKGKPFVSVEREEYFVVQRKKSNKAITVQGKVYDEKGTPLAFVNILALAADSSFLAGSVTEEDGSFRLPAIAGEDCLLKATYIGYCPQIIPCRQQNILRLQPDTKLLKEIVVTAGRPLIERKDGTLTANITGTPLSLMGSASEMISHLPFVTGTDGEYTVLGRGTPEIYINGRKVRDNTEPPASQRNTFCRNHHHSGGAIWLFRRCRYPSPHHSQTGTRHERQFLYRLLARTCTDRQRRHILELPYRRTGYFRKRGLCRNQQSPNKHPQSGHLRFVRLEPINGEQKQTNLSHLQRRTGIQLRNRRGSVIRYALYARYEHR